MLWKSLIRSNAIGNTTMLENGFCGQSSWKKHSGAGKADLHLECIYSSEDKVSAPSKMEEVQCSHLSHFSHSVVTDSLQPHGLQHARLPCSSPTPRTCSNSCSLSQWCNPNISSSVIPFSSCLQALYKMWLFNLWRMPYTVVFHILLFCSPIFFEISLRRMVSKIWNKKTLE